MASTSARLSTRLPANALRMARPTRVARPGSARAKIEGPAPDRAAPNAPAARAASMTSDIPGTSLRRYGWCKTSCIAVLSSSYRRRSRAYARSPTRADVNTASARGTRAGRMRRAFSVESSNAGTQTTAARSVGARKGTWRTLPPSCRHR